jgi:hypothetical protein
VIYSSDQCHPAIVDLRARDFRNSIAILNIGDAKTYTISEAGIDYNLEALASVF